MKTSLLTSLFIALCGICNLLISQDIICKIDYFGVDEGLSNRNVQSVNQDDDGFIWLGTKDGLNRFDGRDFKLFNKQSNGLQSDEINHILKDNNNLLWLIDTDYKNNKLPITIDIFDPRKELSYPFERYFPDAPFKLENVVSFNKGTSGTLLFLTDKNKLYSYRNGFEGIKLEPFEFEQVFKIWQSPNGDIWLNFSLDREHGHYDDYDLIVFDRNGKKRWNYGTDINTKFIDVVDFLDDGTCRFLITGHNSSFDIYDISEDNILVSNTKLRDHFLNTDPELHKFNEICVQYMSGKDLWVINTDKFSIIDVHSDWSKIIDQKISDFHTTTEIFEDEDRRLWIATQFGLFKVDLKQNHFSQILKSDISSPNRIRGLLVENGNLWGVIENKSKVFKKSGSREENISYFQMNNSCYQIMDNAPNEICYCSNGTWTCFNKQNPGNSFIRKKGIFNNEGSFWSYYKDKNGKIWITNDKGEIGYLKDSEFINVTEFEIRENLFYIYQFYEDSKGIIWMVTQGGLYVLDVEQNKIVDQYWSKGEGKYNLPFDNIHHLHEDQDGSFWLATSGDGLVQWSPKDGVLLQVTRKEGLSNNVLHGVYEDKNSNLWISSNFGLNRYSKETGKVYSYLEQDGISHNEFNRISHVQDQNGRIYFGGLNGITAFHPDDLILNELKDDPSVVITDFQQFVKNEGMLIDKTAELRMTKEINLGPSDPFFRIAFNLLTFDDQDKIEFAYKFEDTDPDWNYQNENYIRVSHLKFGTHTLRIKGQGSDGRWSPNELVIKVKRHKPFYLKIWFLSLAILTFLFGGILFYKFRNTLIKNSHKQLQEQIEIRTETIKNQNDKLNTQAQKLKALDKLKTNFFINVAHELRTPLTILLGPLGSILKSHQLDERNTILLKNARESGHNLLALINQIMDLSKLDSTQLVIKERPTNLWRTVNRVYTQFQEQSLIQNQDLKLEFDCDKNMFILLDKYKFERIIYNYLSNAIKFTPEKGTIKLKVIVDESYIILSVKDSGIGIHKDDHEHIFDRYFQSENLNSSSESGTGIGLAIVYEYAQLFNGKAWVESTYGEGARFFFSFPLKRVKEEELEEEIESQAQRIDMQNVPKLTEQVMIKRHNGLGGIPLPEVLIVEDNPNLRNYLSIVFNDRYKLFLTRNGKEALDYLSDGHNIQLIITDIMMPIMNGYELIDKLKSSDLTMQIPVIVLSAKANIRDKIKALRIGVDDYLVKPFEEEELLVRVENLLAQQRSRKSFFESEAAKGSKSQISDKDSKWLENLEKLAFEAMENKILSVNWMAHQTYLSERQFRRKLLKTTGLSPQKYLNQLRLQTAREMLESGQKATILEVALAIGFKDASSFSRSYKKFFGKSPSEHFLA